MHPGTQKTYDPRQHYRQLVYSLLTKTVTIEYMYIDATPHVQGRMLVRMASNQPAQRYHTHIGRKHSKPMADASSP
jgi:hypothetical protein